MPVSFNFNTEGIGSSARAMNQSRTVALAELNRFLREVGKTYQPALKSETPRRTGKLVRSTGIRIKGRAEDQRLEVRQSAKSPNGSLYGRFVRQGTRPHEIRPVRANALRWEDGSGVHFAKKVNHPGTKPNPYHKRALDRVQGAITLMAERSGQRVTARLNDIGRSPV